MQRRSVGAVLRSSSSTTAAAILSCARPGPGLGSVRTAPPCRRACSCCVAIHPHRGERGTDGLTWFLWRALVFPRLGDKPRLLRGKRLGFVCAATQFGFGLRLLLLLLLLTSGCSHGSPPTDGAGSFFLQGGAGAGAAQEEDFSSLAYQNASMREFGQGAGGDDGAYSCHYLSPAFGRAWRTSFRGGAC